MARRLAPVRPEPVFRVLEELTTVNAQGMSLKSFSYGPYLTKGAANGQKTRLQRTHEDYGRLGTQKLRVQTATIVWEDVE